MVNLQTQLKSEVGVLAEYISDELSVFIVAENKPEDHPANGGLRLFNYETDMECLQDGFRLANLMKSKHDLYSTGFSGGKVVARSSDISSVKEKLISVTSELLENLDGRMITGCDLNTDVNDMEKLYKLTPHVLAAVNSNVDASTATAMGVIGAFEAFEKCIHCDLSNGVLVHGCGSVGSKVAYELIKRDIKTYVVDIDLEKTDIEGAISLGNDKNWYRKNFDVILPCSISGLINKNISQFLLNSKAIISAANAPFENDKIPQKLRDSNVVIVPDPLVNAGAVIADSIERYAPVKWSKTSPEKVYNFVKNEVKKKCISYLALEQSGLASQEILELIKNEKREIIGESFKINE
ncbi:glutamate dehydrogenase [Prochlorococcus marinus]|uniref:glutamate dehydrogenase n=1 Tax=Prochlorococcus marinus TaxID=1219 RepID=UPI0001900966|nr:glutamate dehydrogenase [Prochlorococcus marinus]EEE40577.1 glutamate dehydrogenase/leucine dehydrogenase [Prochlorococcus marinus str. MIT 9202]